MAVGSRQFDAAVVPDAVDDRTPELWPCTGEYPVYDALLYYLMTHDRIRNDAYTSAINRVAEGRVCLDIGTGQDLNWARACIAAGARKVYAIEAMPDSFRRARSRLDKLGLGDRIQLIPGRSTEVELPERAELCVSEIIGSIGSSEGAPAVLRDARDRLLVPDAVMIPARCATLFAAASLPESLRSAPAFGQTAANYLRPIFDAVGRPFDVRVMIRNFDADSICSTTGVFEDVDFVAGPVVAERFESEVVLTRKARLDGLILWVQLWCDSQVAPVDSLGQQTNWLPVYFPVFASGVDVDEGDRLSVVSVRESSDDGIHPDYRVEVRIVRLDGHRDNDEHFVYSSPHHAGGFRQGPFYSALFREAVGA